MFAIGDILNQTYRIERLLGEGGMARVYLVQHMRLPKKFALKLISRPQDAAGDFGQRFRREAEVLASLNHLHIVNVVDWNQTPEGLPYLIMEYLEGEDLAHFLSRAGALQPSVALSILHQIGLALQAAHDAGVVHRDLKPGNIFLCKEGPFPNFVKVLDFGIAKLLSDAGPLKTSAQALMGTPAYMSPEQAKGNVQSVDARSDQFSLATILYEMVSGTRPFSLSPGEDFMSTIAHVIFHEPPPLSLPQIGPAVQRAMQKDPAARFASVRDFVNAAGARRAFNAAVSPATLNSTQGEVAHPAARRRKWTRATLPIAVGGLVLTTFALFSVVLLSHKQFSDPEIVPEAKQPKPAPAAHPALPPSRVEIPQPSPSPPQLPKEELAPTTLVVSPVTVKTAPDLSAGQPRTFSHVSKPSLPRPVSVSSSAPSAGPSGASKFEVSLTGATEPQQKLIKQCCIKELKSLSGMPKFYKIVLQRSGTLHIVEAPNEVRQTDLGQCLRNAFPLGEVPAAVTIHVRGNR